MKISVLTLGCKVNKYESDVISHDLEENGHEVFDNLVKADVYIINTCAVTSEAEKKSRQMIAKCKKLNPDAKILVCGCASQNNFKQFEDKNINFVSGTAKKFDLTNIIEKICKSKMTYTKNISDLPLKYEASSFAKQTRTRAYIKIQDGCNNFCSYCIIPYLRGRSRSRDLNSILEEAKALPNEIKEIVLTGINVTDYKINNEKGLIILLEKLDKLGKRLRLSSMEETLVDEDFIKRLSLLKNFCPHFHLSLQSGSLDVLKKMNRKYTPAEFLNSVKLIRKYFPTAGITTDVIVGFPTETDENFEESCDFIKDVAFSGLHIFQYSKREGTVASELKDLSADVKKQRSKVLETIDLQLRENFIKNNKVAKVLIEEKVENFYVGYSENYIKCYIKANDDIINQVVNVKIVKLYIDGAVCELI